MKELVVEKKDLIHNIEEIQKFISQEQSKCKMIAVVKGNGYGLGLTEYAKILKEAEISILAVSTAEEAFALREAGIEGDILLLASNGIEEIIEKLIEENIIVTIGSTPVFDAIKKVANGRKVRAHLKVDTGFGRYGFWHEDIEAIANIYQNADNIQIEGLFSHFAQSYKKRESYTKLQFRRFIHVAEQLKNRNIQPGMLHICNSYACLKHPEMHLDAVRIGTALLGRTYGTKLPLRSIGKMEAKISDIRILPKGTSIGYSCTERTKHNTKIAVVPVGYADGIGLHLQEDRARFYDRAKNVYHALKHLFHKEHMVVKVAGRTCNVLGRLGMNFMIVDVTYTEVKIGDTVQIEVNPIYIQSNIRREYR